MQWLKKKSKSGTTKSDDMSKVHKEEIICPNCQAKGEFDLWESMNVDLDPGLREKIFNDEAFIYTCPECGHRTGIPYGTLYHDMTHHFMLFFDFFKDDDYKYEPVDIPNLPNNDNYIYRHVTGLWRLKEKILILEKGLNDVAIERMKYFMKHVLNPEMAEKGYELYFGDVDYDDKEVSAEGSISFFFHDENDETKSGRFPMEHYYEQCLACDLDSRMKVEKCENIDEGWMAMKLKTNAV